MSVINCFMLLPLLFIVIIRGWSDLLLIRV